jgi:error-prone DNA polymerase
MDLDRRKALWEVFTKDFQPRALLQDHDEEKIVLPEMKLPEHVVQDYAATSLSLKAHPVSFVREQLNSLRIISASSLELAKNGDNVKVAGLVLVRQRPGTASGICFITIEDETGTSNLVVFKKLFDQYRKEIILSRLLMVEGQLQREGEVIHVIVKRCYNFSGLLQQLTATQKEELSLKPLLRSDETTSPFLLKGKTQESVVQGKIFHEGRNFR